MGFRDELDAATARAEALSARVAELEGRVEASADDARRIAELEEALASANARLAALGERAARPAVQRTRLRKDWVFYLGLPLSQGLGWGLVLWASEYRPGVGSAFKVLAGLAALVAGTGWLFTRRER